MTTTKNQSEKFTDDRLREIFRKPWIEFIKLSSKKECLIVTRHFFGSHKATLKNFREATRGIDLLNFIGCYMEVGGARAPEGPILPGPVHPVLAFRMSRSRKSVVPYRFKLDGCYKDDKKRAWIRTDIWEDKLGDDTYFEKHIIGGEPITDKMRVG